MRYDFSLVSIPGVPDPTNLGLNRESAIVVKVDDNGSKRGMTAEIHSLLPDANLSVHEIAERYDALFLDALFFDNATVSTVSNEDGSYTHTFEFNVDHAPN